MRLLTLGGLDLRGDDGTSLRSVAAMQKRIALLCYIALREPGGYTQRNSMLSVLWPDSDESRARNALRNTLHHLRNQIGADALVSRGDEEIAINPAVLWCDAVAFQQACEAKRYEEALALYRGPLLEGFLIADSPEFNDWVDTRRRALAWTAADAARHLAEDLSEENPRAAVGWAHKWVELSPYEERAVRSLMHVLTQTGDRARAIEAFENWRVRLQRDLNATPSAETQRVADSLRRVNPILAALKKPAAVNAAAVTVQPARMTRTARRRLVAAGLVVIVAVAGAAGISLTRRVPEEAGTTNAAALQAFHEGEKAYNAARFDDALAAYGRAVKADPEFARAYLRYSMAAHWISNNYDFTYGLAEALENADRLSEDDRLLLNAWSAHINGDPRTADSLYSSYIDRQPDNADAWLQLGEVRYHWASALRRSPVNARAAFVRSAELAVHEGPALTHLIRIEGREDNVAAVDRYVEQLLRLKPRSQEEFEARIIQALVHRDFKRVQQIAALTPAGEVRGRISISTIIAASVPDPSAIAHLLNALPSTEDAWQVEWRAIMLAQAAAAGGRFAEADRHLDAVARVNPARAIELRSMYAVLPLRRVPPARLRALQSAVAHMRSQYADSLTGPSAAVVPNLLLAEALLDIRLGENTAALLIADSLSALANSPNANVARSSRRWATVVRAEESAARKNWGHALFATQSWSVEPNDGYPDLDHWGVAFLHFNHAEAQFQVRTYRPALTSFESIPDHTGFDIPFVAVAHMRQAQTHEVRDPELARKHYKRVQEIWANADAEMKPHLDFVRSRLSTLR